MNFFKLSSIVFALVLAVSFCSTGAFAECRLATPAESTSFPPAAHKLNVQPAGPGASWESGPDFAGSVLVEVSSNGALDVTAKGFSGKAVLYKLTVTGRAPLYLYATVNSLHCKSVPTVSSAAAITAGSFAVLS